MINLLKDPGSSFTPGSLSYSLSGNTSNVKSLLLQKRNGTYYLCLWLDVTSGDTDKTQSVTISGLSGIGTANSYLPYKSASVQSTWSNPSSITVNVPDHPMIIELKPSISGLIIGDTNIESGTDSGNSTYLNSYKYTLSQAATIKSLSVYVKAASGTMYMGIYADNGGVPGTLKATTAQFSPSAGWNTQNVTSQVLLPAGTYWLAFQPSSDSMVTAYNSTTGTSRYAQPRTYGALPTTFPGSRAATCTTSLYATLIP